MRGVHWPTWIAALVTVVALTAYVVNRASLALSLGFGEWLSNKFVVAVLLSVAGAAIFKTFLPRR